MTPTWMDVIRELRLQPGQRITDGTHTWDIERDGFGGYTLRGVDGAHSVFPHEVGKTAAPAVRVAAAPGKRRPK